MSKKDVVPFDPATFVPAAAVVKLQNTLLSAMKSEGGAKSAVDAAIVKLAKLGGNKRTPEKIAALAMVVCRFYGAVSYNVSPALNPTFEGKNASAAKGFWFRRVLMLLPRVRKAKVEKKRASKYDQLVASFRRVIKANTGRMTEQQIIKAVKEALAD